MLALICLARFSMAAHFQAIPPLGPALARDLGFSQTQIGTLIGLFMFPGVFIALPSGVLANRFGDRAMTLAAMALLSIGGGVMMLATGFPGAFTGRLIGGVGLVFVNVVTTKMVTDWFSGKEIATAMGIMLSAWPLGIALALSTLGALADATSWQVAVGTPIVFSTLAFALVAWLYREPPRAALPAGTSPRLWQISGVEAVLVAAMGAIWMLTNAGYIVFVGFAPAWLRSIGHSATVAGFGVGLSSLLMIVSVPLGGWLTDRIGRINALIVWGSVGGVALVLAFSTGVTPVLWTALFGLLGGVWAPAIMTLPSQVLSPASRATGFGIFYIVFYAGMGASPTIAGWLQDRTQEPRTAIWLAGLLIALCIVALGVFRILQRRLQPVTPSAA
ncbi:MAG TPA: MFS transporter [bacterium]